ncbi:MAG: gliding motility-associated C-terminal domain-containing protein, partial [Aureispira sp.]|nr:gliding motility-associated C-terminal domain-containing protein [Aureispira sp.]
YTNCAIIGSTLDTILCNGDSLIVDATNPNATAYQWQDGSTASSYTINTAGSYWVYTTLTDGSQLQDTTNVSYTNCAIIGSTLDTILCNGDSLIVDVTNPNATAYQWQDGSTTSSYTINTAGSYWVYTTLTDGSQLQDTTNVSYQTCNTTIVGSRTDTSFCTGGQFIVINKATPGAVSYEWHNGIKTSNIFVGGPGMYWVHITLSDGSQIHDTLDISFIDCSQTFTSSIDTLVCSTDLPLIIDASRSGGLNYEWNNGSTAKQLVISSSGIYWSKVTVGTGTIYIDSIVVSITDCNPTVFEKTDTTLCEGDILLLDATLIGAVSYQWGNGSTAVQQIISSGGTYAVSITMTDGSIISDQITITYEDCNDDCNIFIPDAFTPNNDGNNDKFRLVVMGSCNISNYRIIILNRWGQKVFEGTDPQAGWDGKVGNKEQPRAVYMYIANYTLESPTGPQEKQYRGQITLLR